jgi:hypothetical protein
MHNTLFILLIAGFFIIDTYADEFDSISSENLKSCASYYRDGYYNRVVDCINAALPMLFNSNDSLQAYKMLALSYGMINQIDKAKECFNIAFEKDSLMSIDTLAFPPNIALIFNQVKLEKKVSRIELIPPVPPKTAVVYKNKRVAAPILLVSTAVLSAGGAGYLFYKGYLAHNEYSTSRSQSVLDRSWKQYTYSMAEGAACTVVAGVTTWLFFKVNKKRTTVSFAGWENGVSMTYDF